MLEMQDFKSVVEKYEVIFFDSYGVIKSSKGLLPGIRKTFEWLEANKKDYFIITNDASRSPDLLAASFAKAGLDIIEADRIISSGMLAKEFIDLKVNNGIIAYLGTEQSAHYIEHAGLQALPLCDLSDEQLEEVSALVLLDDEGFDWFCGINRAVNLLRRRTIPAIVANPDGAYPVNSQQVGVAIGGISWMIEKIVGKKFIRFGKPDSQIFMFAWEKMNARILGLSKKNVVMVGDTLQTDILGGNKFGLDTVLVLTGNTLPNDAETRINGTGIAPTYICPSAIID